LISVFDLSDFLVIQDVSELAWNEKAVKNMTINNDLIILIMLKTIFINT